MAATESVCAGSCSSRSSAVVVGKQLLRSITLANLEHGPRRSVDQIVCGF